MVNLFNGDLTDLHAQDALREEKMIPKGKERLLILSSKADSIDQQITAIVSNAVASLGRFEVFDRNNLQSVLAEQTLQMTGLINDSLVVEIGNIATAEKGLLVTVRNFSPVKFLGSYKYHLKVQMSKIDISTGKSERVLYIDVKPRNFSETRSEARNLTIKGFKQRATEKLMELCLMTSEVVSVNHGKVLLLLGEDIGIEKGHIFVIREPESKKSLDDNLFRLPSRKSAFVSVEEVSSEMNRSVILRQWGAVRPGDQAVEQVESIQGILISITPSIDNSYFSAGFQWHVKPMHRFDWGAGLWINQLTDTHNKKSYGFDMGLFGKQQLLMVSRLRIMLKVGANLGITFRRDDENVSAYAFLASVYPGINAEIAVSEKVDIVIGAGYRFGGRTSTWDRDENIPAVWHKDSPVVDQSGLFFTIGYKQFLFGLLDW